MTTQTATPDAGPALEPMIAESGPDDRSSHVHRQFIGGLGLVLPAMLWLIAGLRLTEDLPRWALLESISAYYYTGAVAAFVGILVALAVFLFTYQGYANAYHTRDRVAAVVAGAAAVLVAFFPTDAPGGLQVPSWWTPRTGAIHYGAAVVLFSSFSFFSLFLFPKSNVGAAAPLPMDKRVRNWIYISCGVAMLVCMAWAGSSYFTGAAIFWPEALALEFFAISWLVKGRADRTLAAAARRSGYYARHPVRMLEHTWSAVRG